MDAGRRPPPDDFLSHRIDVFAKSCTAPLECSKLQAAQQEHRERVLSSASFVGGRSGAGGAVCTPRAARGTRGTSHALERLYVNDT